MKLYYAETINPRKVCAVARYLEVPVEFVRMDLRDRETRTPEFLALNPNGKVPLLQDGEHCLWESNAIMCRLSDLAGADLWPRDQRQIDVLRWLFGTQSTSADMPGGSISSTSSGPRYWTSRIPMPGGR